MPVYLGMLHLLAHLLLIDNFQAITLILIQGCQDAHTIVQIVHYILDLGMLLGKCARGCLRRCLMLQMVNETEEIKRLWYVG